MTRILPLDFIRRLELQMGPESDVFMNALSNDPVLSVRLNALKPTSGIWSEANEVPWCAEGRYLSKKPVFTLDPLFHAGCYYPQDASSMIIDWLVRNVCQLPEQPVVLDLCGAPGGKSTLLASFLDGRGMLVANEVIKNRVQILAENLVKWGAFNTVVTRNDPADFASLNSMFDLMLVDAPCSGEGMFRKDQRAVDEWSLKNAEMCASRQRRILTDAWPALKQGGFLIYSTCTFNPEENENNITWFAKTHGAEVMSFEIPDAWGIHQLAVAGGSALGFYPHKVQGEGFFVCVLQKTAVSEPLKLNKSKKKRVSGASVKINFPDVLNRTMNQWQFSAVKDIWMAFPSVYTDELERLKQTLMVIHYGVSVGQPVKNSWQPTHALAVNAALQTNAFPVVELDKTTALHYLKGESLPSMIDKKGFCLVSYKTVPLGFVKNIGTRMNNHYPSEWRIRMRLEL
jgi:NOL1/NOP2/sun family putative RNA methylase